MTEPLSLGEFLDKKRDFSHLLVHLTRSDESSSAKEVLECILNEQTLRAYNYYCIFQDKIKSLDNVLQSKFRVVCFTETPIDQIEILLERVQGRNIILEPYGLVFKKDYIREKEGNPVFYITGSLSSPLWKLYNDAKNTQCSGGENKVLALVNKCDETIDFHWEREWRIVGNLKFDLNDIYCGLCPADDISYFENKYVPVKFISPYWGINKILDKLVGK
jgi:hypothetical protein